MVFEQWFDGIYLLGQFNWLRTGCWMLAHNGEAAILELPPTGRGQPSPVTTAKQAAAELAISQVKYLLCTHAHCDHLSRKTYRGMRAAFPAAQPYFASEFRWFIDGEGIHYFEQTTRLDLGGEPLFLVPAPKHSLSDTMVVFRGAICTGDWELGTIRSVHDWTGIWSVPLQTKLSSIARLEKFSSENNYNIHRVFSVHANDKRENVDFLQLMESTREDRPL